MRQSPKPDQTGGVEKVGEEKPAATTEPSGSKTMQELERIQFDALDRAGFDRR